MRWRRLRKVDIDYPWAIILAENQLAELVAGPFFKLQDIDSHSNVLYLGRFPLPAPGTSGDTEPISTFLV